MSFYDIIAKPIKNGINIKVVPGRDDSKNYPNGYRHYSTIQGQNQKETAEFVKRILVNAIYLLRTE